MYSTTFCSDCIRSKRFLLENKIAFTEINIDRQPEFVPTVLALNDGYRSVPTIVISKSDTEQVVLVEPTNELLRSTLTQLGIITN